MTPGVERVQRLRIARRLVGDIIGDAAEGIERPGGAAFWRWQKERAVIEGARHLLRDAATALVGLVDGERLVGLGAEQVSRERRPPRNGEPLLRCLAGPESVTGDHTRSSFSPNRIIPT